ncbi:MAG: hypothetical protein V3T83_03835 [Acidobacteriota bacterium]
MRLTLRLLAAAVMDGKLRTFPASTSMSMGRIFPAGFLVLRHRAFAPLRDSDRRCSGVSFAMLALPALLAHPSTSSIVSGSKSLVLTLTSKN